MARSSRCRPSDVVVTNVEADHLDYYGTLAEIEAAFDRFFDAPGVKVACADDPIAAKLGRAHDAVLYGTSDAADVRIVDHHTERAGASFGIVRNGDRARRGPPARAGTAQRPQRHCCDRHGDGARRSLRRVPHRARSIRRRRPTIPVPRPGARRHLRRRLRAQPRQGRGSARSGGRTAVGDGSCASSSPIATRGRQRCGVQFGSSFDPADIVVVMDVYGAGERPQPGITGKLVVDAVLEHRPWKRVAWLPRRQDVVTYLVSELRPGDLCLTLGAGDITSLSSDLLSQLA